MTHETICTDCAIRAELASARERIGELERFRSRVIGAAGLEEEDSEGLIVGAIRQMKATGCAFCNGTGVATTSKADGSEFTCICSCRIGQERRRADSAESRVAALEAGIDAFWKDCEYRYDMEPREYFESEAPRNGFKYALAMAAHWIWKRSPKVAALEADNKRLRDIEAFSRLCLGDAAIDCRFAALSPAQPIEQEAK